MSTFIIDLPNEVIVEILSWLPPESLVRSKCVCKLWSALIKNLIQDHNFIAKHLSSMSSTRYILFSKHHLCRCQLRTPKCSQVFFSVLTMFNDNNGDGQINCVTKDFNSGLARMYGNGEVPRFHCNGIFLLVGTRHQRDFFALHNPATNDFRLLPEPSITGIFITLGFGFGYDSRANDYKIIRFGADRVNRTHRAEVYQLSTNSWREIYKNMKGIHRFQTELSVYCNGVFFWYTSGYNHILSFDMCEEEFGTIELPNYLYSDEAVCKNLAVWNESVALFVCLGQRCLDIWVLDCNDGVKGSCPWIKLLTVEPLLNMKTPLAFWKNDELLLQLEDETLALYNLRSQELRVIENFYGTKKFYWSFSYVKSLVSVQERR